MFGDVLNLITQTSLLQNTDLYQVSESISKHVSQTIS
jgi:hypothetical protein